MRSHRAKLGVIGVSAARKESAINTPMDLDLSVLCALGDIITLERKRETNENELTGMEEADYIYDNGSTSMVSLNFEKLQPQHAAFALAYGLGSISSAAAGTGYTHTITPIDGDLDAQRSLPSFTAVQRYGETIMKRRFASMFADNVNLIFAKDDWAKGKMDAKGTGKYDSSIVEESITALDNVTELTLAANAVAGSSALGRLDAVHAIRANYGGGWVDVAFSAVSSAAPAVITITSVGGAGASITYKMLYAPAETVTETVTANDDVTELTLAANSVDGQSAAARLANVKSIEVELTTDVWTAVAYSAVSSAAPAVITITAPGSGSTPVDYRITYHTGDTAWKTMPDRVQESPLRVSQVNVSIGGTWTGSAFVGGKDISYDVNSIEYSLANAMQIEFTPGADGAYANRAFRDQRTQTLSLDKQFRSYLLQNYLEQNETFGVHILAEGAVFSSPHKFTVELIFPKCGLLKSPIKVDGKRLGETGDLRVLEDSTYGSVIAVVKNEQAAYAA